MPIRVKTQHILESDSQKAQGKLVYIVGALSINVRIVALDFSIVIDFIWESSRANHKCGEDEELCDKSNITTFSCTN